MKGESTLAFSAGLPSVSPLPISWQQLLDLGQMQLFFNLGLARFEQYNGRLLFSEKKLVVP